MRFIKALLAIVFVLVVVGAAAAVAGWFWLQNEIRGRAA